MTKNKHTHDKHQRLLNEEKKRLAKERAVKREKERVDRVWRKLARENIKEQETKDDLQRATNYPISDLS